MDDAAIGAEIEVVGEAIDPLGAGPSQVTDVDPAALPAGAELADALMRVPGAVVTRTGGVGDLASVSVRGAGARQVEVLVDGIPLNPEGGGAVDLSELPVGAFEQVRVIRGLGPALSGSTALGGAILLVPGRGDRALRTLDLAAGAGPTARGAAVLAGPVGPVHLWAAADALGTGGAWRTFDDGGTRTAPDDDGVARRENNDTTRLATVMRAAVGGFTALHAGLWRDDGVPGFTFAPSPGVRYGLTRHLVGARLERPVGDTVLAARTFGVVRDEVLRDPDGEIGLGDGPEAMRTSSVGGDLSARIPVAAPVAVELGAGARADRYADPEVRRRVVARGVASVPFGVGDVDVAPGIVALAIADADDTRWLGAPRVGARWAGGRTVVRANAGAVARPPDLTELYGDRGALVGNPELRPERGFQADLGPTWTAPDGAVEVVAFVARYRDLIAWTTGPQGVSRPENLGQAVVYGLELAGSATIDAVSLSVTGAAMRAVNLADDPTYRGNQLPRVPVVSGTAVVGVDPGPWRVSVDVVGSAGTWADTANFTRWPPRVWLGATAGVGGRVALELDVRNVLDTMSAEVPRDPLVDDGLVVRTPIVDHVGFPLPGRTVLVSVRVRR